VYIFLHICLALHTPPYLRVTVTGASFKKSFRRKRESARRESSFQLISIRREEDSYAFICHVPASPIYFQQDDERELSLLLIEKQRRWYKRLHMMRIYAASLSRELHQCLLPREKVSTYMSDVSFWAWETLKHADERCFVSLPFIRCLCLFFSERHLCQSCIILREEPICFSFWVILSRRRAEAMRVPAVMLPSREFTYSAPSSLSRYMRHLMRDEATSDISFVWAEDIDVLCKTFYGDIDELLCRARFSSYFLMTMSPLEWCFSIYLFYSATPHPLSSYI